VRAISCKGLCRGRRDGPPCRLGQIDYLFCGVRRCAQHTQTRTTERATSEAIGRIHDDAVYKLVDKENSNALILTPSRVPRCLYTDRLSGPGGAVGSVYVFVSLHRLRPDNSIIYLFIYLGYYDIVHSGTLYKNGMMKTWQDELQSTHSQQVT